MDSALTELMRKIPGRRLQPDHMGGPPEPTDPAQFAQLAGMKNPNLALSQKLAMQNLAAAGAAGQGGGAQAAALRSQAVHKHQQAIILQQLRVAAANGLIPQVRLDIVSAGPDSRFPKAIQLQFCMKSTSI